MIAPFVWLWKQFNGSQISAIASAITSYMKSQFEQTLDYWQHLSINTANSSHLTTIGALHGLARPIMEIADDTFFWFSTVPEEGTYYPSVPWYQSEHGLSSVNDMQTGGKFADMEAVINTSKKRISASIFRTILKASRDSKAELGSLVWIDDVLNALYIYLNPGSSESPDYSIDILTEEQVETNHRSVGDIRVNLKSASQWGDYLNEIAAEVNLLGETVYFPVPTMFAESYL